MLRSLLSCLGTRSQPDPLRAVDNQGERRGRFGRRRKTVGRVDEGDAGSVSKSTCGCCFRKRREKVARSAQLDEDLCDGNVQKRRSGEQSVCHRKAESTEASKVVNQEQLHADVSLPTESLEVIDQVCCPALRAEPFVIDWNAEVDENDRKFQIFRRLMEPLLHKQIYIPGQRKMVIRVISTEVLTEPDADATSQRVQRRRQPVMPLDDTFWIGNEQWPTVCSLQGATSSEAEQQPNQDLHVCSEQLDPEEFLSSEPLEKIHPIQCNTTWIVSTEPDVCDREAMFAAAREKFRASSARFHQAVAEFDRRLVEPMMERSRFFVFPRSLEPSTPKDQDLDN